MALKNGVEKYRVKWEKKRNRLEVVFESSGSR